jgi:hypothetical protein
MELGANQVQLTFGEQLVGKTFNPSGDDKVARIKALAAEMADIVHADAIERGLIHGGGLAGIILNSAFGEILNAQMNAVKFVTLKP